jgi:hypothetical protein
MVLIGPKVIPARAKCVLLSRVLARNPAVPIAMPHSAMTITATGNMPVSAYRYDMQRARRDEPMEPERRLPELDHWVGLWVAVKDGKVIAAAPTSLELVDALHKLRPVGAGKGAVAQYVPEPSDGIMIGVG